MPNGILEIKDWLSSNLNPSIFTLDSMEGVIVTALAIIILYRITKNLTDFIGARPPFFAPCIGERTNGNQVSHADDRQF